MKRLFFCAIIFLFTQVGCKKCEQRILPESVKPYLFKEGSYWVFQNESTSFLDTFFLIKQTLETRDVIFPVRNKCATQEIYSMDIISSSNDSLNISSYSSSLLYLLYNRQPRNLGAYVFDSELNNTSCQKYELCSVNLYNSFSVGANTFSNVNEVTANINDDISGGYSVKTKFYWSPYVGMVKAIVQDTTILDLVSWNVVQ